MANFKCKVCGGTLVLNEKNGLATCEYCGTIQTLPKFDNDKLCNLYDRASHYRMNNEYDKAMALYEQILLESFEDPDIYWSIVLCRFGIEYVEDPATNKRIPTVNRTQFSSILKDEDYKKALEYADSVQKKIYREEAKYIDGVQKGILDISNKEKPFDIFICYKETDNNGRRTIDSVIAQDIYKELINEGYRVFFPESRLKIRSEVHMNHIYLRL